MERAMTLQDAFSVFIKFFFILTPFFILAVFIALTEQLPARVQRALALRIAASLIAISLVMLLFGDRIFEVFGITVDAFRIGAGALLFLSALSLVEGRIHVPAAGGSIMDLAVVPLACPITLGPGSIGALLVMGSEARTWQDLALTSLAVAAAGAAVGALLCSAAQINRLLGKLGISVISKLTGLVLAALSCQMIFTGAAAFLKP
ncbi:MAG: NAAT family transporter [Duodenibacillus sp.]|nr:NAAT family transporter [Duodenibacillus sp.]